MRAPAGRGVKVGTYHPGNLKASLRVLPLRRSTRGIIIGPKVKRNGTGVFGPTNPNAFYAHIVEQRNPFIKSTAASAMPAFLTLATRDITSIIRKYDRLTAAA